MLIDLRIQCRYVTCKSLNKPRIIYLYVDLLRWFSSLIALSRLQTRVNQICNILPLGILNQKIDYHIKLRYQRLLHFNQDRNEFIYTWIFSNAVCYFDLGIVVSISNYWSLVVVEIVFEFVYQTKVAVIVLKGDANWGDEDIGQKVGSSFVEVLLGFHVFFDLVYVLHHINKRLWKPLIQLLNSLFKLIIEVNLTSHDVIS